MNVQPENNTELFEKFPYMAELFKRIDTISNAIDRGGDGLDQAYNLMTDLPHDWAQEILKPMTQAEEDHSRVHQKLIRREASKERNYSIMENHKRFARTIKNNVITLLNKKGILLLTRRAIETSTFSARVEGDDDE